MALEIFRLVGSIFVDSKAAEDSIHKTETKAEKLANGLHNVVTGAGKVAKGIATTAAAIGTAAVAGGTAAVSAFADYEQAVGGIETLFGTASGKMIEYANEAYKTAGLSATAYMETVTTFSASLLQSMGGDTAAAADAANQALIDMSDNAAKMGTDMSAIQSAYSGFAKQNYTMLDNLKLGYGGTKSEMERLLADAQALSGVEYDISNLQDVYNAIHVIQGELGITGTTAKEAGSTISGTVNSIKQQLSNFVTQIGGALAPVVQKFLNFVTGNMPVVEGMIASLIPVMEGLFNGLLPPMMDLVGQIFPLLTELLSALIPPVTTFLEQFFPVIIGFLDTFLPPLIQIVQALMPVLIDLMGPLLKVIEPLLHVFDPILIFISALSQGLSDLVSYLKTSFIGDWKKIWTQVGDFFKGIWDGMKNAFKVPINWIIDGINKFINGLNKIKIPDWVPAVGGKGFHIGTIPRLAAGGVLEKGQVGLLEGNGAEAVVPLENNRKWIRAVADDMQDAGIGGDRSAALLEEIIALLEELLRAGIYLDGDRLVGALAGPLDKKLGKIAAQKARA